MDTATLASQQMKRLGPMNSKRGFIRCEHTARLDDQALQLRSSGMTYEEIAQRLGCNRSTALRRCQRALVEIPRETAEQYRVMESLRLDDLFRVAYEQAMKGSLRAIDRCLSIMVRRAKLFGLDAPPPENVIQMVAPPRANEAQVQEIMDRLLEILEL